MFNIVKGTHDVIKEEAKKYSYIEEVLANFATVYGYKEFRTPIIENSELFTRSVGNSSDIVRKEMYTFEDKGGRSITLRPEMTAGTIRSMVNEKLFAIQDYPVKAFYCGPNFRYERPQQGRYRQFNQFGVECAGVTTVERDVEVIALAYSMLQFLGFEDVKLSINTLGDEETRTNYKNALKEYFSKHVDNMCSDCKERFNLNIMRILDCKVESDRKIIDKAPKISSYLSTNAKERFDKTLNYLKDLDIPYVIDEELVRGLDYYTGIVFEFHYTSKNGNNYGAICAGGHYGHLISEIGGPDLEGIGFAFGIERLAKVMEDDGLFPDLDDGIDLFIMPIGEKARNFSVSLAYNLRNLFFSTEICYEDKSFSQMFKKAERRNAKLALIIGENELEKKEVTLKDLNTKEQETIKIDDLLKVLYKYFEQDEHNHEHSEHECCCGHHSHQDCDNDDHECCHEHDESDHCCCHKHEK